MRFIIDAHLPKSIGKVFADLGHEAIHTSEFHKGNASKDQEIIWAAAADGIVVSKDDDFFQSFLLFRRPPKLIHVKIGNMRLQEVKDLFSKVAPELIDLLSQYDLLELYSDKIIVIA